MGRKVQGITVGTLIKRGKSWHWKYRVDGVVKWESFGEVSKIQAESKRQERIGEYRADREAFLSDPENPTIADFEAKYWPWAEDHKRRNTIEFERRYWPHLVKHCRAKRVGDITRDKVEGFKRSLRRRGPSGKPMSAVSVNNILRHMQAILNHGIDKGFYSGKNPLVGIDRYTVTKTTPDFLSEEEIGKLLAAAEAHSREMHWLFLLCLYAGLRRAEVINCRWEWVQFDHPAGPRLQLKEHPGFELKDYETRHIPLSGRIIEALLPHRQAEGFLFRPEVTAPGKHRYRWENSKPFRDVCKAAGVERATFQLCRHSFASWHVLKGTPIKKVKDWLGHAKIQTTIDHYAGLLEGYDKDIDNV